jgi:hypothetical protein
MEKGMIIIIEGQISSYTREIRSASVPYTHCLRNSADFKRH